MLSRSPRRASHPPAPSTMTQSARRRDSTVDMEYPVDIYRHSGVFGRDMRRNGRLKQKGFTSR